MPLLLAIDGPAASGKGSLARRLAEHFNLKHLDTGKLYRFVGKKLLESEYELDAANNHESQAALFAVEIANNINLDEIHNTNLNDEKIGHAASIVSAIPDVRKALLDFQREVAASPEGAVLDGRDIGSVVCPDADFKFFITANVEIRAERRHKELQNKGNDVIYTDVLEELKQRDDRDRRRAISPLQASADAICIDTTALGIEGVLDQALRHIKPSKDFEDKDN
jgi:cytidylate kinase